MAAPQLFARPFVLHAKNLSLEQNRQGKMLDAWVTRLWWAVPNLLVPLFIIPIVMVIQWLFSRPPSLTAVIADGQVCFYSIAILAASWYDVKELHLVSHFVDLESLIFLEGSLATLGYGILASDHLGSKMMISRNRAAVMSAAICLASMGLALHVHSLVVAAH